MSNNKTQISTVAKKKILLVDDDNRMLALLETALSAADYDVCCAASIVEAETKLASCTLPDMAIIDVHLEHQDGFVLAEKLRLAEQHMPFILLSGDTAPETLQQASALGALSYMTKPISIAQLLSTVEVALGVAEQLRDLHTTRNQLESALKSERDINIAVGITMMHYRVDRQQAFELLRKIARNQQRKLADLAPEIIQASTILNLTNPD